MDYGVVYILFFLINCIISPMYAKSLEELNPEKEIKESRHSMEDDDVERTEDNNGGEALLESKERIKAEFLTFSAPEEDDFEDEEKIEDLLELLKPKHILLIEAPENTTITGFDAETEERGELVETLLFGENTANESEKNTTEKF